MYDVAIIGKGPAGISASLYTSRAGLKTLVIGKKSRLINAHTIDNYYGFIKGIDGRSLLEQGELQAERLGVEIIEDEVLSVQKDLVFEIRTSSSAYSSRAVLIATGNPPRPPLVKGAEQFEGNGIHYCVSCDGFFYRDLKLGVLGSKDYAVHVALDLLNYSPNVTIYTNNRPLELSDRYLDGVKKFTVDNKAISLLDGSNTLEKIVFKDGTHDPVDGIFVAEGSASSIDFARKLAIAVEADTIPVDQNQKTNIEGVFAAGDCTGGVKQIATAVGQGAIAGRNIVEYLNKKEG